MKQESGRTPGTTPVAICRVGLENFNQEVLSEEKPILLLCMPEDTAFFAQLSEIEKVQARFGEALKMCYLEDSFIGAFMERYGVTGTPTFLIFTGGKVHERLLGQVSQQDLKQFLRQSLPNLTQNLKA